MSNEMNKSDEVQAPILIAAWPGIGNVGILAIDSLRRQLNAEKMGKLDPWEFFYPKRVKVTGSLIEGLEFPDCFFYYYRAKNQDLIFFIGDEQPESAKDAHAMAASILDMAQDLQCRRVYTAAAGIFPVHHEVEPRVHVIAGSENIIRELLPIANVIPGIDGGDGVAIYGLNGLLLGQAQKRGWETACFLGEVPDYLVNVPFPLPYPARSIFKVFMDIFSLADIIYPLEDFAENIRITISGMLQHLPLEIKEKLEQRKSITSTGEITREDGDWLKGHIGDLFKKTP